jgi:hypothetical protein
VFKASAAYFGLFYKDASALSKVLAKASPALLRKLGLQAARTIDDREARMAAKGLVRQATTLKSQGDKNPDAISARMIDSVIREAANAPREDEMSPFLLQNILGEVTKSRGKWIRGNDKRPSSILMDANLYDPLANRYSRGMLGKPNSTESVLTLFQKYKKDTSDALHKKSRSVLSKANENTVPAPNEVRLGLSNRLRDTGSAERYSYLFNPQVRPRSGDYVRAGDIAHDPNAIVFHGGTGIKGRPKLHLSDDGVLTLKDMGAEDGIKGGVNAYITSNANVGSHYPVQGTNTPAGPYPYFYVFPSKSVQTLHPRTLKGGITWRGDYGHEDVGTISQLDRVKRIQDIFGTEYDNIVSDSPGNFSLSKTPGLLERLSQPNSAVDGIASGSKNEFDVLFNKPVYLGKKNISGFDFDIFNAGVFPYQEQLKTLGKTPILGLYRPVPGKIMPTPQSRSPVLRSLDVTYHPHRLLQRDEVVRPFRGKILTDDQKLKIINKMRSQHGAAPISGLPKGFQADRSLVYPPRYESELKRSVNMGGGRDIVPKRIGRETMDMNFEPDFTTWR